MKHLLSSELVLQEAPPGGLEAAQKAGYHTLATLFHEPGHTCLLFLAFRNGRRSSLRLYSYGVSRGNAKKSTGASDEPSTWFHSSENL